MSLSFVKRLNAGSVGNSNELKPDPSQRFYGLRFKSFIFSSDKDPIQLLYFLMTAKRL
jgi:hypothetical protein